MTLRRILEGVALLVAIVSGVAAIADKSIMPDAHRERLVTVLAVASVAVLIMVWREDASRSQDAAQ